MDLETNLKGLTIKRLNILKINNITTTEELINFFPKHYLNLYLKPFLKPGNITIKGKIYSDFYIKRLPNNVNMLLFYVTFNNQNIKCIYFGKPYFFSKLKKGNLIYLNGEYNFIKQQFNINKVYFEDFKEEILPVYGIKGISDKVLNEIIINHLDLIDYKESIPIEYIIKYKLLDKYQYYLKKHSPLNNNDLLNVYRTEKYELFFKYFFNFKLLNYKVDTSYREKRSVSYDKINEYIKSFPFTLTRDQLVAIDDLLKKMQDTKKINTLIQGDVGCGKTVIAYVLSYAYILNNLTTCFLAPTELLAKQHFENFQKYLPDNRICLLTQNTKNKNQVLEDIFNKNYDVVIGTHALLSENVKFSNLGLLLIDEQHRFGVKQRSIIQKKYEDCDAIYFTATPIPRTLGLTLFGNLNIIDIKTLPTGKKKPHSFLFTFNDLDRVSNFINERCKNNEQVFIVVPSIRDNALNTISIDSAYEYFSKKLNYEIKCIHSKIKSEQRDQIMNDFKEGLFKILISTTIVEVGIDIKQATTMVLLNAERFGLATSHQLRGRVGRNNLESYFIMVSDDLENERLNILLKNNDGFDIANEDFKLRGPGDYLGDTQSGQTFIYDENNEYEMKIMNQAIIDSQEFLDKISKEQKVLDSYLINLESYKNN